LAGYRIQHPAAERSIDLSRGWIIDPRYQLQALSIVTLSK